LMSQGYQLRSRKILVEGRLAQYLGDYPSKKNSWQCRVGRLTDIECKCANLQVCPMCQTTIEGAGISQQMGGGDLHVGQMMLPADRQLSPGPTGEVQEPWCRGHQTLYGGRDRVPTAASGVTGGAMRHEDAPVAVAFPREATGLCLWKYRQTLHALRA
jgi:hypothetical protein